MHAALEKSLKDSIGLKGGRYPLCNNSNQDRQLLLEHKNQK